MASMQITIRRARKAMGWSQRELAHRAGIGQSHVLRVEQESDVRISTLQRLASALDAEFVLLPRETASLAKRMGDLAWKRRNLPEMVQDAEDDTVEMLFTVENTAEE